MAASNMQVFTPAHPISPFEQTVQLRQLRLFNRHNVETQQSINCRRANLYGTEVASIDRITELMADVHLRRAAAVNLLYLLTDTDVLLRPRIGELVMRVPPRHRWWQMAFYAHECVTLSVSGRLRIVDRHLVNVDLFPKQIECHIDGYFIIMGRNAYFQVLNGGSAFCTDLLIIYDSSGYEERYLMLSAGVQRIKLGPGFHVVLVGLGLTVLIVGAGGFNELDLRFDGAHFNALIQRHEPLPVYVRAYRGVDYNYNQCYTIVQINDQISLASYDAVDGVADSRFLYRERNPFLVMPIVDILSTPIVMQGMVSNAQGFLFVVDQTPVGRGSRLNRVVVNYEIGELMDAAPFVGYDFSNYTQIRPRSGSLLVLSWNGQFAEIRAEHDSCLYVAHTIAVFFTQSMHLELTTGDQLMIVISPVFRWLELNHGAGHVCFLLPSGSVLVSAGFRFRVGLTAGNWEYESHIPVAADAREWIDPEYPL